MADKQAVATVQLENDNLRVTEWRFTPGAATGYHRHAYDYVVVPVVDGELELVGPDGGKSRAQLEQGKSYFRNAGVQHDVINAGANYVDAEVVRDGNIITSRKPDDLPAFMQSIIQAVREMKPAMAGAR